MPESSVLRLLYVDDDLEDARALGFLLGEKCRFRHAGNLDAARTMVATEQIDLVLCKQQLADGSGLEFMEELQLAGHSAWRIILTGIAGRESLFRAIDQGTVNYHLQKPLRESELRMLLNQVSERDSLRRQNRELMGLVEQLSLDLDESQALFRILFETVPEIILVCDGFARILMANKQAERTFKTHAQGLIGRTADLELPWSRQNIPSTAGELILLWMAASASCAGPGMAVPLTE